MVMSKSSHEDRRDEERFERKEELNMKIVFSSDNPGLLGKIIDGGTIDVSPSGLRIMLNQPIKIDSVLDVWVNRKQENKIYFLTGNVRWCKETDMGGIYQIGLVLRERTDTLTDLASWRALFRK